MSLAVTLAACLAGAAAWRAGRRPALPGSREPRLRPLGAEDRRYLDEVARLIDPADLRATVESMPGPRDRFGAREAMASAEERFVREMTAAGWRVEPRPFVLEHTPPGGFTSARWIPAHERLEGVNLLAVREGVDDADAVVVIAHYDTVPDTVGADDNTAGVAALLALARAAAREAYRHSVILVATDLEDAGLFGAYVLAPRLMAERRVLGVVCFDTMAYTSPVPGSQRVPPGLDLLYPDQVGRLRARASRGDGTMLVFNGPAEPLARALAEALVHLGGPNAVMLFRDPADLPLAGPLLRRFVPVVRHFARSDHRPFWEAGVPAVLVTDSAEFRYPHYHRPTDTPEKLDYGRLAEIAAATAAAVARVAGRVDRPVEAP